MPSPGQGLNGHIPKVKSAAGIAPMLWDCCQLRPAEFVPADAFTACTEASNVVVVVSQKTIWTYPENKHYEIMDSNASLDSSFHAHWRAAWTCTSMYLIWTVFVSTVLAMHVQIGSHALTPNFEGKKKHLNTGDSLFFRYWNHWFLRFATFGYCTGIC